MFVVEGFPEHLVVPLHNFQMFHVTEVIQCHNSVGGQPNKMAFCLSG